MSNIYPIANDGLERTYDQASTWIAKLDRGLTSSEHKELQAWLAADQNHREVFLSMAKLWDKMDALERLADLFPRQKSAPPRRNRWQMGMAASVLVALLVGLISNGPWQNLFESPAQVTHRVAYKTAIGESKTIELPDRSTVKLNTNSALQVTYTADNRLLELQAGEIHVEVAHDTSRPLSVLAHDQIIQAVGTAFNVQMKQQEVELIVTDGKVIIAKLANKSPVLAKSLIMPRDSMTVSKGQIASLSSLRTTLDNIESSDIKANLSWQQGNLVFKGESLEEAMAEVSRYTAIEFQFSDDAIKNIKIAGRFKTGDINGLIGALNQNFKIKTDRLPNNVILLRSQ
jgi:transmembrane sensor